MSWSNQQNIPFHALQPASLLLLASISTAPLVAISTAWAGPDEHASGPIDNVRQSATLDEKPTETERRAWLRRAVSDILDGGELTDRRAGEH